MTTQPRSPESKAYAFTRMTAADFNLNYAALHASVSTAKSAVKTSPAVRKVRKSPEEDLHMAVFEWIFLHETKYPALQFLMHSPNGGGRSKAEAGKFKAMGVRKGVPDIIGPFPQPGGRGFACELKAPGDGKTRAGKLTPEQAAYLAHAESQGWVTGVCFTLDQFIALVSIFLGAARV